MTSKFTCGICGKQHDKLAVWPYRIVMMKDGQQFRKSYSFPCQERAEWMLPIYEHFYAKQGCTGKIVKE